MKFVTVSFFRGEILKGRVISELKIVDSIYFIFIFYFILFFGLRVRS